LQQGSSEIASYPLHFSTGGDGLLPAKVNKYTRQSVLILSFISCLWIGFFVYRSTFGFSFSVSGGGGAVGVDGCAATGGLSMQRRAGRWR
jgi:hypothetical protein